MFTMSQNTDGKKAVTTTPAAPVLPDIKTLPEYIQMSQTNAALSGELTALKREKYIGRIEKLAETGRINKAKYDEFKTLVGTYQFSAAGSSTEFIRLDAQLEFAESQPEGAVWSPAERMTRMSVEEESGPTDFFKVDNTSTGGLSEDEIEKMQAEIYD